MVPLKQRVPYGPGACGRGATIWRLKTRPPSCLRILPSHKSGCKQWPQVCRQLPLPSASLTAHGGQNPCLRHVGLLDGTWGLWSATHYMSSIPHLAQDNKSKLQNPDGELRSPVKSGHPAPEREERQENACFLSAALECSSSETPGAGLPGSFLMRWPRPAQDAPHPGEILGTRLALRSRGRPGGAAGRVASRAGPRLRQAGSCKLPGHCPGDTRDPDVKACMLIVRERKQDSCCSEPRSHGEFDVRV